MSLPAPSFRPDLSDRRPLAESLPWLTSHVHPSDWGTVGDLIVLRRPGLRPLVLMPCRDPTALSKLRREGIPVIPVRSLSELRLAVEIEFRERRVRRRPVPPKLVSLVISMAAVDPVRWAA